MNIWIVRKHQVVRNYRQSGWFKSFTIDEICYTKENANAKVKRLNAKAQSYKYTVQKLTVKETQ
jgi:hypothetical protein